MGGGTRAPLRVEEVESWSSERAEAAVLGREVVVDCLALVGSSFTGGAGAMGSSTGSTPSGPKGPMESSRLSRVVDWARLPYRRGVRDLEAAGLTPVLEEEVGRAGDWVDVFSGKMSVMMGQGGGQLHVVVRT